MPILVPLHISNPHSLSQSRLYELECFPWPTIAVAWRDAYYCNGYRISRQCSSKKLWIDKISTWNYAFLSPCDAKRFLTLLVTLATNIRKAAVLCNWGLGNLNGHRKRHQQTILSQNRWRYRTPARAHTWSHRRFHCIDLLSLNLGGKLYLPLLLELPGSPKLFR